MNKNPETFRQTFKPDRLSRKAAVTILTTIALGGLATACQSESSASPHPEVSETLSPNIDRSEVFAARIDTDDSEWFVKCRDEDYALTSIEAETGDTLLSLAQKAGTQLTNSLKMGAANIPLEVYATALAEINRLDDPNLIIAGETYEFPDNCGPN